MPNDDGARESHQTRDGRMAPSDGDGGRDERRLVAEVARDDGTLGQR